MQPVTISIPNHTKGDTWEGLKREVPLLFDGGPPPADLASCRMYVRNSAGIILKFKTTPAVGEKTITIDNAATWLFTVEPTVVDITAGKYRWDFETTDADGAVRTLYSGTWTITKEYSYD